MESISEEQLNYWFEDIRCGDLYCPYKGCLKTFFTSFNLAHHLNKECHFGKFEGSIPCTHCPKMLKFNDLKIHWKNTHKMVANVLNKLNRGIPTPCANFLCSKMFSGTFTDCKLYLKHSINCTPFLCHRCKGEFSSRNILIGHQKMCTGVNKLNKKYNENIQNETLKLKSEGKKTILKNTKNYPLRNSTYTIDHAQNEGKEKHQNNNLADGLSTKATQTTFNISFTDTNTFIDENNMSYLFHPIPSVQLSCLEPSANIKIKSSDETLNKLCNASNNTSKLFSFKKNIIPIFGTSAISSPCYQSTPLNPLKSPELLNQFKEFKEQNENDLSLLKLLYDFIKVKKRKKRKISQGSSYTGSWTITEKAKKSKFNDNENNKDHKTNLLHLEIFNKETEVNQVFSSQRNNISIETSKKNICSIDTDLISDSNILHNPCKIQQTTHQVYKSDSLLKHNESFSQKDQNWLSQGGIKSVHETSPKTDKLELNMNVISTTNEMHDVSKPIKVANQTLVKTFSMPQSKQNGCDSVKPTKINSGKNAQPMMRKNKDIYTNNNSLLGLTNSDSFNMVIGNLNVNKMLNGKSESIKDDNIVHHSNDILKNDQKMKRMKSINSIDQNKNKITDQASINKQYEYEFDIQSHVNKKDENKMDLQLCLNKNDEYVISSDFNMKNKIKSHFNRQDKQKHSHLVKHPNETMVNEAKPFFYIQKPHLDSLKFIELTGKIPNRDQRSCSYYWNNHDELKSNITVDENCKMNKFSDPILSDFCTFKTHKIVDKQIHSLKQKGSVNKSKLIQTDTLNNDIDSFLLLILNSESIEIVHELSESKQFNSCLSVLQTNGINKKNCTQIINDAFLKNNFQKLILQDLSEPISESHPKSCQLENLIHFVESTTKDIIPNKDSENISIQKSITLNELRCDVKKDKNRKINSSSEKDHDCSTVSENLDSSTTISKIISPLKSSYPSYPSSNNKQEFSSESDLYKKYEFYECQEIDKNEKDDTSFIDFKVESAQLNVQKLQFDHPKQCRSSYIKNTSHDSFIMSSSSSHDSFMISSSSHLHNTSRESLTDGEIKSSVTINKQKQDKNKTNIESCYNHQNENKTDIQSCIIQQDENITDIQLCFNQQNENKTDIKSCIIQQDENITDIQLCFNQQNENKTDIESCYNQQNENKTDIQTCINQQDENITDIQSCINQQDENITDIQLCFNQQNENKTDIQTCINQQDGNITDIQLCFNQQTENKTNIESCYNHQNENKTDIQSCIIQQDENITDIQLCFNQQNKNKTDIESCYNQQNENKTDIQSCINQQDENITDIQLCFNQQNENKTDIQACINQQDGNITDIQLCFNQQTENKTNIESCYNHQNENKTDIQSCIIQQDENITDIQLCFNQQNENKTDIKSCIIQQDENITDVQLCFNQQNEKRTDIKSSFDQQNENKTYIQSCINQKNKNVIEIQSFIIQKNKIEIDIQSCYNQQIENKTDIQSCIIQQDENITGIQLCFNQQDENITDIQSCFNQQNENKTDIQSCINQQDDITDIQLCFNQQNENKTVIQSCFNQQNESETDVKSCFNQQIENKTDIQYRFDQQDENITDFQSCFNQQNEHKIDIQFCYNQKNENIIEIQSFIIQQNKIEIDIQSSFNQQNEYIAEIQSCIIQQNEIEIDLQPSSNQQNESKTDIQSFFNQQGEIKTDIQSCINQQIENKTGIQFCINQQNENKIDIQSCFNQQNENHTDIKSCFNQQIESKTDIQSCFNQQDENKKDIQSHFNQQNENKIDIQPCCNQQDENKTDIQLCFNQQNESRDNIQSCINQQNESITEIQSCVIQQNEIEIDIQSCSNQQNENKTYIQSCFNQQDEKKTDIQPCFNQQDENKSDIQSCFNQQNENKIDIQSHFNQQNENETDIKPCVNIETTIQSSIEIPQTLPNEILVHNFKDTKSIIKKEINCRHKYICDQPKNLIDTCDQPKNLNDFVSESQTLNDVAYFDVSDSMQCKIETNDGCLRNNISVDNLKYQSEVHLKKKKRKPSLKTVNTLTFLNKKDKSKSNIKSYFNKLDTNKICIETSNNIYVENELDNRLCFIEKNISKINIQTNPNMQNKSKMDKQSLFNKDENKMVNKSCFNNLGENLIKFDNEKVDKMINVENKINSQFCFNKQDDSCADSNIAINKALCTDSDMNVNNDLCADPCMNVNNGLCAASNMGVNNDLCQAISECHLESLSDQNIIHIIESNTDFLKKKPEINDFDDHKNVLKSIHPKLIVDNHLDNQDNHLGNQENHADYLIDHFDYLVSNQDCSLNNLGVVFERSQFLECNKNEKNEDQTFDFIDFKIESVQEKPQDISSSVLPITQESSGENRKIPQMNYESENSENLLLEELSFGTKHKELLSLQENIHLLLNLSNSNFSFQKDFSQEDGSKELQEANDIQTALQDLFMSAIKTPKSFFDCWYEDVQKYKMVCYFNDCNQSFNCPNLLIKHMARCICGNNELWKTLGSKVVLCIECNESFELKKYGIHYSTSHGLLLSYLKSLSKTNKPKCNNYTCEMIMRSVCSCVEHYRKCKYLWKCNECHTVYDSKKNATLHKKTCCGPT
ncbi:MATH and LRR domain-containing protein PFE0570w isoform X4 [Hydra vulgaris]|uniref:MATH and LRR domain-containing protein PFE0570w isoform X4 n=1 Tax=Hydra vulgaris TaxID=6087 RepID=A0ABM4D2S6_HYDVU